MVGARLARDCANRVHRRISTLGRHEAGRWLFDESGKGPSQDLRPHTPAEALAHWVRDKQIMTLEEALVTRFRATCSAAIDAGTSAVDPVYKIGRTVGRAEQSLNKAYSRFAERRRKINSLLAGKITLLREIQFPAQAK
jgi:hypothetical protein